MGHKKGIMEFEKKLMDLSLNWHWLKNSWLCRRKNTHNSSLYILLWWEVRRIHYNLILLITFIGSMSLYFGGISLIFLLFRNNEEVDAEGVWIWLFIYFFIGNIGYTAGWITEIFIRKFLGRDAMVTQVKLFHDGVLFTLIGSLSVVLLILFISFTFIVKLG